MSERMAEVVRMHSQMGLDERGRYCKACGAHYGHSAERELHRRASAHVAAMLTAAGFGDEQEARAQALEEAADEAGNVIAAGDIAECAAYCPGESGRHEAVAARDSLYEDGPSDWLRARAAAVRGEG